MKTLLIILFVSLLSPISITYSRDYVIYSVVQEIPMGEPGEIIKKNFYVNIGGKQGVEKGTVLDVYRVISRLDPYETKKRYNYKVRVGTLKVLHAESESAIAHAIDFKNTSEDPLFEIENFMIGDIVNVKVD